MKTKIISFIVIAFLVVSAGVTHSATTLMTIGRSPFCAPLQSQDDLISMIKSRAGDVRRGFELAGRSELYEPFIAQIDTVPIERKEYRKGTYFEWMFFKKTGGQIGIAKDVTWGNEDTFPGYQFDIVQNGTRSTFVVPFGCGNIAMLGEGEAQVAVATPMNQAPRCSMTISQTLAFCGEILVVDTSSSFDPNGDIVGRRIAVVDNSGQLVSERTVTGDISVFEVTMPCGTNTIKVSVVDDQGRDATSDQCIAEVTGVKRVRFLGDAGYYHQLDPGNYFFGRIGAEYRFTQEFSVLGLLGGAVHFDGSDGDDAFLIDLLGEYKFSRYFINLGIGGWITDGDDDLDAEDTDLDFIAGIGARVYGKPEGFNASVFLEVRSAFDEFDDIDKYGRYGVGVRFRF